MREYREFLDFVKENITEYLPEEYRGGDVEVKIVAMPKANDIILDGLTICKGKTEKPPIVYLAPFYGDICDGAPEKEVMERIVSLYMSVVKEFSPYDDRNIMLSWESIKEKIGFRLINTRMNTEALNNKVFSPVDNMAKAYSLFMSFDEKFSGDAFISDRFLEKWEISLEELDALANENMERMFPPVLKTINDVMRELLLYNEGVNILESNGKFPEDIMYVLTTENSRFASAVLYPGLLKKIRMILGKDFYILPSSTDEMILVPKGVGIDSKELQTMLRQINHNVLGEEGMFLSDDVYEYLLANDALKVVQFSEN